VIDPVMPAGQIGAPPAARGGTVGTL